MRFSRLALVVSLSFVAAGCAELAQLGGLEVCFNAGGHPAPSSSPTAAPSTKPSTP